jgi:Protein of unknown function (DUF1573)
MRSLAVVATLWLAAGVPSGASPEDAPKSDSGTPSIELPKMRIDLGKVYERDTYEYNFAVRNKGSANLVIDVKPGCGCTLAKFDSVIAPGGAGNIALVVDGHKVDGEFTKQATVLTNDPNYPELTLMVAGSKVPLLTVTPPGTIFLQGVYGDPVEQELTLESHEEGLDLKVLGVRSDIDDKITYEVKPGTKKGEYKLRVTKNPTLPTTSEYGSIFVKTNSTRQPEAILQVHVMTKGSISVSPNILNFGAVNFAGENAPAEPVSRYVMLTKTTPGTFQVQDVTVSNPCFAAKVEPVNAGQIYRVNVTFTPPVKKAKRQNERAELIIHTDDERSPSIRVQVMARTM